MNYQFLAMIVGFITVVFTMITLNYQLRNDLNKKLDKLDTKIDKVEEKLSAEINRVEDRLLSENKATNAKLDTFLLALFKGSVQLPKQNDKDAA